MADTPEPIVIPVSGDTAAIVTAIEKVVTALDALEAKTKKAGDEADKAKSRWDKLEESFKKFVEGGVRGSAVSLTTIGNAAGAISGTVQQVSALVDTLNNAAGAVAELATEQDNLDEHSAVLGLSFDDASAAAGRFMDETDAMRAATTAAASGIRLHQDELNALARVAGAYTVPGQTVSQTMQSLTEGVLHGTRALRDFGPELAGLAGGSHTAAERLAALQRVAEHTTPAVDNTGDALERFRDQVGDMERTVAHAAAHTFVDLITAQSRAGAGADEASDAFDNQTTRLRAMGQAAAETAVTIMRAAQAIAGGIALAVAAPAELYRTVFAALARARSGDFSGAVDELRDFGSTGTFNDIAEFTFQGVDGFTANITGESAAAAVRSDFRQSSRAPSAASSAAATERDRAARNFRGGGGGGGGSNAAQQRAQREMQADASDKAQEATRLAAEEHLAEEQQLRRAAAEASQEETQREEKARQAAVEAQILDNRADNYRSFTETFEALHQRQVDAVQETASTVSSAFDAMGQAFGKHLQALIDGKEAAGEAALGMLGDTLNTVGREASVKAGMQLGEGFAMLFLNPAESVAHFTAAGIFTGVAAAAGLGAAAIGGSPGSASASRGGASERERVTSDRDQGRTIAPTQTIINHYAPVFGGREGTDAEVGDRMGRYTRAADARLRRES